MPFVPYKIQPSSIEEDKEEAKANPKKVGGGIFSKLATSMLDTGLREKLSSSVSSTGKNLLNTGKQFVSGKLSPSNLPLQLAGDIIGGSEDALGAVIGAGAQAVAPKASESVENTIKNVMSSPAAQKVLTVLQSASENVDPETAHTFKSLLNVLMAAPGGAAGGKTLVKSLDVAEDVSRAGVKAAEKASNVVKSTTAAVKPTFSAVKEVAKDVSGALGRGKTKVIEAGAEKARINALPEPERDLYRAGLPEETVARITTAKPTTIPYLSEMVQKVKSRSTKARLPDGSSNNARALDVAGDFLTKKAAQLSKSTKAIGKRLGEIKKELRGQDVDISSVQDQLLADMDDMRLTISDEGNVIAQPGIAADPDVLEVLTDVYKYAGSGNVADAEAVDLLRAMLRKSYGASGTPFNPNATRLLNKYRESLLSSIDAVSPEYGKVARAYAQQMEVLEDFTKLLGYKGSMEGITKQSLRAGEITRRMLGQASARPTETIQALLSMAKKAGFDDGVDFDDLVRFADDLDDIAGVTQTTGFQGGVQRGVEAAANRMGGAGTMAKEAFDTLVKLGAPGASEKISALEKFFEAVTKGQY